MFQGSSALFNANNKSGSIHGARIELVMKDNQFNPERAKANAFELAATDPAVLALLHPLGTRQVAAVSDAMSALAVVGPNTGTVALRKKASPNTLWARANYDQEIDRLVSQAAAMSQTRTGLVHADDPFGHSRLADCQAAMARHKPEGRAALPGRLAGLWPPGLFTGQPGRGHADASVLAEDHDIGDLSFSFGRNNREGTRFVDLAVIGRDGQLLT